MSIMDQAHKPYDLVLLDSTDPTAYTCLGTLRDTTIPSPRWPILISIEPLHNCLMPTDTETISHSFRFRWIVNVQRCRAKAAEPETTVPVSYTHLTLPTKRIV